MGGGIGGWGDGKGEGTILNRTHQFEGRNVGICLKKSRRFRREKSVAVSKKSVAVGKKTIAVGKIR